MRKNIADLVLLIGGVLAALRLIYLSGWVNKLFPSLFIVKGGFPTEVASTVLWSMIIGVLFQALGIVILTGVIFYLLRKGGDK